ncbi:MFS general substrate transporter [Penicillium hispanicum]|uniref:MFS general substrate transporter n=1 Tax=Penicillium hispanicum TaxID=1080232 RepID=UPI002542483C|nr:MFS general substrate transporter [Penicillium hispanicum]KAJ5578221.1 MFS general substrate transporter [Penicillium hispanicum]
MSRDAMEMTDKNRPPTTAEVTQSCSDSTGLTDHEVQFLPFGSRLVVIAISLMLAVFCVALDNTIIAVAIPKITDQFHALDDVGWYASSYLLTTCSFQLLYGKLYALFNIKWVFLAALFIFELGSLICGVAPTSTVLIVGRAIAGLGSAGIFTGALVTVAHIVALEKRPIFFALIGGVYGIASVAGPLMGGAFTDHATWRWCFYINLPIGAITAIGLLTLLKLPPQGKSQKRSLLRIIRGLDPLGTLVFVPTIVCALLALQWGGIEYPWSNGRIVALFVVFGVGLLGFVGLQIAMSDDATVPVRIARQRSILFASLFAFCIGASFFIMIYYIPIWVSQILALYAFKPRPLSPLTKPTSQFQAIRKVSAVHSGIDSFPMILANVVGIMVSGGLTTRFGYYAPFFIASSIIMSLGAGLVITFTVDISQARWVGFLFLYGLGVGCGFQQGGVAAQAVLPLSEVSIGTAIVMFLQMLGGSLFTSVAESLFTTKLVNNLTALNIPGLDPSSVVNAGATGFRDLVAADHLPEVLVAYNEALVRVFQLSLIMGCLSILGAVGVEWRSVKEKKTDAVAS